MCVVLKKELCLYVLGVLEWNPVQVLHTEGHCSCPGALLIKAVDFPLGNDSVTAYGGFNSHTGDS